MDWLAHNLPTEGAAASAPTAGSCLRHNVPTARPEEALATVRARVDASPYRFALVVAGDRTLLGRLRHAALDAASGTAVHEAMESGPSTVRPQVALAAVESHLRAHHLSYVIVTDPEGRLLGTVHREDLTGAAVSRSR
ncbi:CBS domain-containing protein [Micromonospora sp. DR5-3]|uniref:CBS domain-containing protein n=1 Tax=unclassified Micromonospora TaxID=2617518 RepID=UPI0011D99AA6|nr:MULTISPECIES: CBS domain-containing protein [unclassified Micromonospora]MCW3819344.1 CBS domain-containing protein [Micromonospora sp. DR5-3]TYC21779.1 CBS domain-containing protein [Micromonospora sp. MP36]